MIIYKYTLSETVGPLYIDMKLPFLKYLLDIQIQNETIVAWFLIDETDHEEDHTFINIVGTGQKTILTRVYRKTLQHNGFVWHVFMEQ